jgi:hypothetical protein
MDFIEFNGKYYFSFKLEDERPIAKVTRGTSQIMLGNQALPES